MTGLNRLSNSSASTYLECSWRWKLTRLDGLSEGERSYFSLGRSVHFACEHLGVGLMKGQLPSLESAMGALNERWVRGGFRTQEEEYKAYDEAVAMVKRLHGQLEAAPPAIAAVEVELFGGVDGLSVPLHGVIDRVDRLPDGRVGILDYKTSKQLGPSDAEKSDQLTVYQALYEASHPGEKVGLLSLHSLRTGRVYDVPPRTPERVRAVIDTYQSVVNGIAAGEFAPSTGNWCSRCTFRYDGNCPAYPVEPGFVALI